MSVSVGQDYVLTRPCPDKPGFVYAVSSFLVQQSAHILASQQYGESPDGWLFLRAHFSVPPTGVRLNEVFSGLSSSETSGTARWPIGQGIRLVGMEAALA